MYIYRSCINLDSVMAVLCFFVILQLLNLSIACSFYKKKSVCFKIKENRKLINVTFTSFQEAFSKLVTLKKRYLK